MIFLVALTLHADQKHRDDGSYAYEGEENSEYRRRDEEYEGSEDRGSDEERSEEGD